MTLADADLERLLTLAASDYPVPDDGIERILAAEAEQDRTRRRFALPRPGRLEGGRPGRGVLLAGGAFATVVALVVALAVVPGGSSHGPSAGTSAAGSAVRDDGKVGVSDAIANSQASEAIRNGPESMPVFPGTPTVVPAAGTTDSGGAADVAPTATSDQKLVRTGSAQLMVAKGRVPAAQTQLEGLATLYGGVVAKENATSGANPSADVTLRVPGDRYADLVASVRRVGTVTNLATQATDVTSKYTDLAARIDALQKTRDTYLTMLSKATTIGDTLSVQQRLDDVQSQLEQLQGQQKVLDDQVSLGTLDVTVTEKSSAAVVPPAPPGAWTQAWDRSTGRFEHGIQHLVAALGPLLLVLLFALALALAAVAGRRVVRRLQVR